MKDKTKSVMIIGSGGREHALGWKLGQDREINRVFYSPGSDGFEGINTKIPTNDFAGIENIIAKEKIDLTIVGPETPLANGIVDYLTAKDHKVFGPNADCAKLESDKFFSYDIMQKCGIPQAKSIKCFSIEEALEIIAQNKKEYNEKGVVIKARGLTGGKGVSVCESYNAAIKELKEQSVKFGPEILIAEKLFGEEFSIFGIADGKNILPIPISVQDHKRLNDGDKGPNTGGMGAYCPAPIANRDIINYTIKNCMSPVIKELNYKGFLYAGMIMTKEGPKVLEYNARLGDPECQPLMMMIENLYSTLELAMRGEVNKAILKIKPGAACCVVLTSKGYPGKYENNLPITGIEEAEKIPGIKIFHAGTKKENNEKKKNNEKKENNQFLTNGGRVLGVTAYSEKGIHEAVKLSYEACSMIDIPGRFHYRKDIAYKAMK